jgi:hypothetical protein
MSTIFQKYAVAIFSFVTLVLGAVQAEVSMGVTPTATWQVISLGIGGIITFFVPLVEGKWAGILKTGFSILGAVGALAVPYFLDGDITASGILLVVIGAINVIATQLGVVIRKDDEVTPEQPTVVTVNNTPRAGTEAPTPSVG